MVAQPNSAVGHKSILSSLWFTFLQEGVYLLLTEYRTGVGYWGSEFLIYLWRSRNQNLRWVTNLYHLLSGCILARGCLLSAYSIQNRCWLLGFRVSYLFVVVTKPKSAAGHKSILSSLWFTFWPEGVYCLLTVYRTGVATGVPSFLFICGGHETKIYFSRQSGASTKTWRNLSRSFVYICIMYLKE